VGAPVSVLSDTADFLTDPGSWEGPAGIGTRLVEHLAVSGTAVLVAALVALPVAFALGHTGRGGALVTALSNASRAVPTFAVLILLAASYGEFGDRPTVIALVLFAIPPLLTNAHVGVRDVDREVREAARGMGMTGMQVLRRVELPLALPLVAAGFRTAAVQVVATATLAAYVGGGGLGRLIIDGIARADPAMYVAGGLLVAALALLVEVSLAGVQRALTPGRVRRPRTAVLAPQV
jgi:osmoprotectant transport system permease protein